MQGQTNYQGWTVKERQLMARGQAVGERLLTRVEDAEAIIAANVRPAAVRVVDLLEADGMVLAQDVVAGEDLPAFDRAGVDGYAVKASDIVLASTAAPVRLEVTDHLAAGQSPPGPVAAGTAVGISTGAPVPPGADAVLRMENVVAGDDWIEVSGPVPSGADVAPAGEDIRAGSLALPTGTVLRPAEIGLLAALGQTRLAVIGRPRVGIISTGDELVDAAAHPGRAQIRNSSAHALWAYVRREGGAPRLYGIARDDLTELAGKLLEARGNDLILTTGGVSVGTRDLVAEALEYLGAEILFWRVAMRPGTPVLAARWGEGLVIGLSGNPAAAMTAFEILVRPALALMRGRPFRREMLLTTLDSGVKGSGVRRYLRARIYRQDDTWRADVAFSQRSGVLSSMTLANGYVVVPEHSGDAQPGSVVQAFCIDP